MPTKLNFLQDIVGNVLIRKALLAFLILLFAFFIKRLVISRLFSFFMKFSSSTQTKADDFLVDKIPGPIGALALITGVYVSVNLFRADISSKLFFKVVNNFYLAVVVYLLVRLLFVLIESFSLFMQEWSEKRQSPVDNQLAIIIRKSLKVLVAVLAVLFLIQNLGYSVSGLVASLGLGGLTVALAAKDTVSNFFGSIIIIVDSPFKVGDWIKTGNVEGVVEEIGFRSTKIRTFEKSLISVPNFIVANQSVENFSLRDKRRIRFSLGIEYRTPVEKIEQALNNIRNLIAENKDIHNDFYLVNLNRLADSSLEIFVYCFTTTSVWKDYLNVQEGLYLDILKMLEREGVGVAFPSQSLYIEKMPENGNG
ncbi:MAG: mechanosensitive ion channel family protein [Acidobacteria bacterium]|nr:mechanosensitive ion channel family protein [Acidobacteriota bacterium]